MAQKAQIHMTDGSIDLHVCFGLEHKNISNSNDRPLFTEIVSLLINSFVVGVIYFLFFAF